MSTPRVAALLAAAALAAYGLSLAVDATTCARVDDIVKTAQSGRRLAVTIHGDHGARGGAIVIPGRGETRAHVDSLARELARRGVLAVTIDLGGRGDSEEAPATEESDAEDIRAAMAVARREGAAGPLVIVAHGASVPAAARVAREDVAIAALVALGRAPENVADHPRAVLVAAGALDPFRPYEKVLAATRDGMDRKDLAPGKTFYDEKTHLARRLFFSSTCEGAGETWDGAIAGEVAEFVDCVIAGRAVPESAPSAWRPPVAASLRFVSHALLAVAVALAGLGIARLAGVPTLGSEAPVASRLIALGLSAFALTPVLLARAELIPAGPARALAPGLVAGALASGALASGSRSALATVLCFVLGWIGGTALGAAPAMYESPDLTAGLPLYIWQGIAFRLDSALLFGAARAIPGSLASASVPTTALGAALALEVLLPGQALGLAGRGARLALRLAGGTLPERLDPAPAPEKVDRAGGKVRIGMVVLALASIAIVVSRARDGKPLDEGLVGAIATRGLRWFILPVISTTGAAWATRAVMSFFPEKREETPV